MPCLIGLFTKNPGAFAYRPFFPPTSWNPTMIRIVCPGCGSKLNAKDELAGQTRKCPKCAQTVHIVADPASAGASINEVESGQHVIPAIEAHLPTHDLPGRLNRESHYLICGKTRVEAAWENNGAGWMLKTNNGFVSAKRNREQLPTQGNFQLVELKFIVTSGGRRLTGIVSYQLASRWALTTLDQADDLIVGKISGLGCLNKEQKNVLRLAIKEQFMRPVWEDAAAVLEYLANTDYHSPGVVGK